jgi:hypothetical protein
MAPDLSPDALASAQSQASVFRLLTWKATIPLEIRIAKDLLPQETRDGDADRRINDGEDSDEDAGVPTYYVSAVLIAFTRQR